MLRADAAWVTVCNWAEALERRYGGSQLIAGADLLDVTDVRATLFDAEHSPYDRERSALKNRVRSNSVVRTSETLVKDARWALVGLRSARPRHGHPAFAGAPYVWQRHNLFHRNGRAMADALGVPLLHFVDAPHVWESEAWGINRGLMTRVTERLGECPQARSADLVACVSEEVADATVRRLGVDPGRIIMTPNTVDAVRFTRSDASNLRTRLGLDGKVVVGWVGSFRPFHAVDALIEGFDAAARTAPQLHLVLVGSGAVLADARADVARRGLDRRVTFVGSVPNEQVPEYISLFDIAMLPAAAGPFHYSPLKLREFAAAGNAIVAADVGDVSDTLRDGDEAVIVRPGSADALSDAVIELARDPSRRRKLGDAAQRAANTRFGMQRVLELIEVRLQESADGVRSARHSTPIEHS